MRQQTLRFGESWARIAPWRGGGGAAHLVVGPEATTSSDVIRRCVDQARRSGYHSVLTSAVGVACADAFVAAGFEVREHLHLLAMELHGPPLRRTAPSNERGDGPEPPRSWSTTPRSTASGASGRRAPRRDRGHPGLPLPGRPRAAPGGRLRDHRLRGDQGYLQRIAVDPAQRRAGWGRALVADGLGWLWRHGCSRAFVNTQLHNDAAIALYESFGFRRLPEGLCVLGRPL